jgi:hypothetical protein
MASPSPTATPSAPTGQSLATRLDDGLPRAAAVRLLPTSLPVVGRPDPAYAGAGR